MHYNLAIADNNNIVKCVIKYNNKNFGLLPIDREKYDKNLKLNGVALTKSGKELLSIIPIKEYENYTNELNAFLKKSTYN